MGRRLMCGLVRIRVTATYVVVLVVVSVMLLQLGPDVQDRVVRHASTNLHNLSHGRVGTLVGSAFVLDDGPGYLWLPGLVCLLALGELTWRSARLVLAFGVGHVGATLLVAVGLTGAVELEWLSPAVTRATDVGMSYGAMAVLGALTAAIARRWRGSWLGWWLALGVAVVVSSTDFTDVGHLVAFVLGTVVATRFGRPQPWTHARFALLGVAALFGYQILVAGVAMVGPMVAGAAGALLGGGWSHWQWARRAAVPVPATEVPTG